MQLRHSWLFLVPLWGFMVSCKAPQQEVVYPTISFFSGPDLVSKSSTWAPGSRVIVKFVASKSDERLARVQLFQNGLPFKAYRDSGSYTIPERFQNQFIDSLQVQLPTSETNTLFDFKVTDVKGKSGAASLSLRTQVPVTVLDTGIVLFGQNAALPEDTLEGQFRGSYYSVKLRRVFDSTNVQPFIENINLVYGVTAQGPVLVSPTGLSQFPPLRQVFGASLSTLDSTNLVWGQATGTEIAITPNPRYAGVVVAEGQNFLLRSGNLRGLIWVRKIEPGLSLGRGYVKFDILYVE